jgi:RNA polymerase sigma factor (sigma-70 family)
MGIAMSSLETPPDAELLTRFVKRRDEAAFTELVRRHGPVVRAACRRTLGETPDADDAFQAVFLILSQKAGTLRQASLLGPWLHTVAVRAAGRARLLACRRMARERQVVSMPEPVNVAERESGDWLPLLDAEIRRLPERMRVPLVLCELQGMSRTTAARQLGIPEGTISSRLARARDLLRKRLRRKGAIVATAGLTAAFLYSSEAISAPILAQTTRAAISGASSAPVAALTQGVLQTMLYAKLKIVAVVVLTLGIATGAILSDRFARVPAEEPSPDGNKSEAAKADRSKLQGKWQIVSAKTGGKEPEGDEAERILKQQVVFDGEKVKLKKEATFSIDPSKSPKEIDLEVKDGPEREVGTWKGIYKLNDDELTICIVLPKTDRPTDFVSTEGEMVTLLKLTRVK